MQKSRAYIPIPMPPMSGIPPPGMPPPAAPFGSGLSATIASVVINKPATEPASCRPHGRLLLDQ